MLIRGESRSEKENGHCEIVGDDMEATKMALGLQLRGLIEKTMEITIMGLYRV